MPASYIYNPLLTISPVQLYAENFPMLARIACDILAILGVNIFDSVIDIYIYTAKFY